MRNGDGLTYAFFGSGVFAARCLQLLSAWRAPHWVVTAPPKPAGRGRSPKDTPVKDLMDTTDLLQSVSVLTSADASRDEAVLAMKKNRPASFSFVVDFGQIIREPLLAWDAPVGCLNIHPSLLPLYRGAAPVQRALMDGARETGVTIFKLAAGMDNGPILLQERIPIAPGDDKDTLLERAAVAGTNAFIDYASRTPLDRWRFTPQDDARATHAPKISKDDERIDWTKPAEEIANKIRALRPAPGAWTTIREKRLRILEASSRDEATRPEATPGTLFGGQGGPLVATGAGLLALASVQMEGKKIGSASEWWNGLRPSEGEMLV